MKYKIDVVRIRENSIQLNGWVIGKTPESKAEFEVLGGHTRCQSPEVSGQKAEILLSEAAGRFLLLQDIDCHIAYSFS